MKKLPPGGIESGKNLFRRAPKEVLQPHESTDAARKQLFRLGAGASALTVIDSRGRHSSRPEYYPTSWRCARGQRGQVLRSLGGERREAPAPPCGKRAAP